MLIAGIGSYDDDLRPWFVPDRKAAMPWPDRIKKAVLFVGIRDGGRFVPKATAFKCAYEYGGLTFGHLVTAEHVVSGLLSKGHEIWIRVNMKNGEGGEFPVPSAAFSYYPDKPGKSDPSDVAVVPFGDFLIEKATGKRS